MQLIFAIVFAHVKHGFSHDAAQISSSSGPVLTKGTEIVSKILRFSSCSNIQIKITLRIARLIVLSKSYFLTCFLKPLLYVWFTLNVSQ